MNNIVPIDRSRRLQPRNFQTRRVNEAAAEQIVARWAEKGWVVKAEVVDLGYNLWSIKSDMIAGLPHDLYILRCARKQGLK